MKIRIYFLMIAVVFYAGCSKVAVVSGTDKVSIISISPSSGPAGTTVVITGSNYGSDI